MKPKTETKKRGVGRPANLDFDEFIDKKFGPFIFVRALDYTPGKRRIRAHMQCEITCKYGHPAVVEWGLLLRWKADPKRKRSCPKCGKSKPGVPVNVQLLLARLQRRVRHLSEERRRFFFALVRERLPLAKQFEDTNLDTIIGDCLAYAETDDLDVVAELADLQKPIPSGFSQNSQTGFVMKFNMPD